jgi:molybdopterin/thiamine biosynthesis adenylyltransferase/rhodanese-related sulfurtransferase
VTLPPMTCCLLEEPTSVSSPSTPSAAVLPNGILPPVVEPAADLSIDEIRRYSRHLIIPDVAMDGQKRLKNAKVLVVGAGGLGSPALMYLAAAGVGTLGIVDFDVVDESNLQRQIIHGQADIGRPKAVSAAESVAQINPYVQVNLHQIRLDSSNVMELFAQYDLIVDGTDNFATRYLVNDACVLLGKPYVWGSIYRFDGQASVFWAEHGPCYRCLYPEPPPPGMVPSCAEGGVLGVLCASIGSIQVNEAIKLLTGIGEPLVGRLMVYDALEMSYHDIKVRKDPECAICGKNPTVTELIDYEAFCGVVSEEAQEAAQGSTILATELKAMQDAGEDFLLVDVREPAEWEIVRIPGAILIPKGELPAHLSELPQDKPIVVYCKSGVRSAEALATLKGAGFKTAKHVQGGVTAWATQVDKGLPVY